jgi:hypothetical protein
VNTIERSVDAHKLIFQLRWHILNHYAHLNCCSFVDFCLHLLPQFELIVKFFQIGCHRLPSTGIFEGLFALLD